MKNQLACVAAVAGLSIGNTALAGDWQRAVDFGLSVSKGNTDSSLLRTGFKAKKNDADQKIEAGFTYSYGERDGENNENEIVGNASYHKSLVGKNFLGLRFDGRRDKFADIDYRFSFAATYGYYWIDNADTVLSTEFGLGYTVEDKGQGSDHYLNGLFDQRFEHKLNEHAKVFQSLAFAPRINDISDYRIEFKAGLETQVTETIAFKLTLEDRYESEPAQGRESNDLKIIAGLSYTF